MGTKPKLEQEQQDKGSPNNELKSKSIQDLIKAGIGLPSGTQNEDSKGGYTSDSNLDNSNLIDKKPSPMEPLPRVDERQYHKENECYNTEDYIKTLALGTI